MPRRAACPVPVAEQPPPDFASGVGDRIAKVLATVGVSQSDVARALSVAQSTLNKWTKGTRLTPPYHLAAMCDLYGCSLDFLYRGKIGGVMRRGLELALVAQWPDLVGEVLPDQGHHARVAVRCF